MRTRKILGNLRPQKSVWGIGVRLQPSQRFDPPLPWVHSFGGTPSGDAVRRSDRRVGLRRRRLATLRQQVQGSADLAVDHLEHAAGVARPNYLTPLETIAKQQANAVRITRVPGPLRKDPPRSQACPCIAALSR